MKPDKALLKSGVFWATILVAWLTLGTIAYHFGGIAYIFFALGSFVSLFFFFDRVFPFVRR